MKGKILVVEDESSIRSFIVINLRQAGYKVCEAQNGSEALAALKRNKDVGVALLDVMLPDIDGFEVCRRIRGAGSKIGIIMLTARTQEVDRVTGLTTGADDYVTKPFSPVELIARVDALFRRIGEILGTDPMKTTSGPFVLNVRERTLTKRGELIKLTYVEFEILKVFFENRATAISREDIFAAVWGEDEAADPKVIDVNIRRIRVKIEDDPQKPTYLQTVWGFGYRWSMA